MSLAEQRVFRGAKIRTRGTAPAIQTALHPQVEHRGTIGYEVAFANRHKNWAKRWFRRYRSGEFWP